MSAINCKEIAADIKERLKPLAAQNKGLAIIHIGNDIGSEFYVRNKIKDAEELGVPVKLFRYSEDEISQGELEKLVMSLNNDLTVKGIVIQSPLPAKFDEDKLVNMVDDEKDVDGFKNSSRYIPATPKGVLTILDHVVDNLDGAHVVLIGRGKTTNYPLIKLLLDRNVTLTICHSHTSEYDLKESITHSDVVISAVGIPEFLTKDMFKIGGYRINASGECSRVNTYADPVVVDIGISRVDGKQVGDCSSEAHDVLSFYTPWINGCGLLTRTMLFSNLLEN